MYLYSTVQGQWVLSINIMLNSIVEDTFVGSQDPFRKFQYWKFRMIIML